MTIYRLCNEIYKNDLSGTGAKLTGGRWNEVGIPVLYTTENISLAVLEVLVNTSQAFIPLSYYLLTLHVPNTVIATHISREKLKKNWKDDPDYTKWMGSSFCKEGKALFLKVPSAVVDEENNYIFNPLHKSFKQLKLISARKFQFDKRLY